MKLRTKGIGVIAAVFSVVLGASYLMFGRMRDDIMSGLGVLYARNQALYNRARLLHPVMRELALAQKLADSFALKAWARNESDPALRAAGLRELEEYRRFFADGSYFFVVDGSGNYYFNDRDNRFAGAQLRYTLDPNDPEDRWYYRTLGSGEAYRINVDFDEKLAVTKVWMNVVVSDAGKGLGIVGTGIDLTAFLAEVVEADQAGVANMIVDAGGAIQAYTNVELIDFRSISKNPAEQKTVFQLLDAEHERAGLRAAMERLRATGGDAVEVLFATLGGQRHLFGLVYIREIDWYGITLMDAEQVFGARRFVPFAVLLVAALVVLCATLVLALNRFVLARISRLESSMRHFALGTPPAPAAIEAWDEMGRLEEGFRTMAATLRESTAELENRVAARTRELAGQNEKLNKAMAEIRTLSGLLPTCAYCKKIRDRKGRWNSMESYISERTEATFSHGICPECLARAKKDGELP